MSERGLWSAVVLQAHDDLQFEPRNSVIYGEAEAFFFHAVGPWAQSRQTIADQLEVHADDITRLGRLTIAARNIAENTTPIRPDLVAVMRRKPLPPRVLKDRQSFIDRFMANREAA